MKSRWRALLSGLASAAFVCNAWGAITWDGGGEDNEFSTQANWSNDQPLEGGEIYSIEGVSRVDRLRDSKVGILSIRGTTVYISRGVHHNGRSGSQTRDLYFHGSGGTINQSGGEYHIGHLVSIGSGDSSRNGHYNLTGGKFVIYRGGSSLLSPDLNPPKGPSLEVGDNANDNQAVFEISGKSILETRGGVVISPSGVFNVVGSRALIGIGSDNNVDGFWTQMKGGTLKCDIDSRGVSRVFIDDVDEQTGVAIDFRPGSKLELGFATGTEPQQGSWVIFVAENTVFDRSTLAGLSLTDTTPDGWSFSFDNIDGNGVIIATFAPKIVEEPF